MLALSDIMPIAMVPIPLERTIIADRGERPKLNADSSFTVTIGYGKPEDRSCWLSAIEGAFYLTMRIYWPEKAALDGSWTPPSVKRIR